MSSNTNRVEVPGSKTDALPQAELIGEVPANERFQVTVRVRRRDALPPLAAQAALAPAARQYLTKAQFEAQHGASQEDLDKVAAFAGEYGLAVEDSSSARRSVLLSGTATQFGAAFGVELKQYQAPAGSSGGAVRGRQGLIYVPEALEGVVVGVFGLDNRPFATPHFTLGPRVAASAQDSAFYPNEIAKLYDFPTDVDGKGQTIGILELGGGFRQSELTTYFAEAGIASPPTVSVASFAGGGANTPGTDPFDPANPDVEVMLDIEVAGSVAPGAEIVVYFAKDASDQGFLDVLTAAVHDPDHDLSVISISWGGPEGGVGRTGPARATKQFQDNFDQTLQSAAALGVTVCAASGDSGSADFAANNLRWDGHAHVDFPASSPHVLACGGTRLTASGSGVLQSEVVWNPAPNVGTGGGVSRYYPLPPFQANAQVPHAVNPRGKAGRGVPDVSGDAAQESGYRVLCDGQQFPDTQKGIPAIGGTSAVSPLWAGLIALLNQSLGVRLGWVNPQLYQLAPGSGAFHDITDGSNGDYSAGPGWDACTGLGSPDGAKLRAALKVT